MKLNKLNENIDNFAIYKKKIKNNPIIILKSISYLKGFTAEEVFEAIADVSIRKEWDKVFSEFKIIDYDHKNESEYLYMVVKVKYTV
jgi:hypothetical protein